MTMGTKANQYEADADFCAAMGIAYHEGYVTPFSRTQVLGAWRNGVRVKKVKIDNEATELRPIGATGTILGSISYPPQGIGYFVSWDDAPTYPTFVAAAKVFPL